MPVSARTEVDALPDAWASTVPRRCVGCGKPHPHVDDLCAFADCDHRFYPGEIVYRVSQARRYWVCRRHVVVAG